jgi:hypothetical protein
LPLASVATVVPVASSNFQRNAGEVARIAAWKVTTG